MQKDREADFLSSRVDSCARVHVNGAEIFGNGNFAQYRAAKSDAGQSREERIVRARRGKHYRRPISERQVIKTYIPDLLRPERIANRSVSTNARLARERFWRVAEYSRGTRSSSANGRNERATSFRAARLDERAERLANAVRPSRHSSAERLADCENNSRGRQVRDVRNVR